MMSSSGSKHARDGDEGEEAESGSPRLKRFFPGLSPRAEELINILEEEEEEGDCEERNGEDFVAAEEVLCGVMKSLEEEISSSSRGEGIRSPDDLSDKEISSSNRGAAEEAHLCGVMKSLEEEISSSSRGEEIRSPDLWNNEISSSNRVEEIRSPDLSHMDEMSYLLRASDDELGIPPSPSVYEDAYSAVAESQVLGESNAACNLEGLWQLEDQLAANSYSNWFMLQQLQAPEYFEYADDENQERDFASTNCSLFDIFSEGGEQRPMSCR